MRTRHLFTSRFSAVILMAALIAIAAFGQSTEKPSTSAKQSSSAPAITGNVDNSTDERPQHMADYTGSSTSDRMSRLLITDTSPLHWGHLNVVSFSFTQSYQNNTESSYNNSVFAGDLN